MAPKFAALLSPPLVGTVWWAQFLSRAALSASGKAAVATPLGIAGDLTSRLAGFALSALSVADLSISFLVRAELAPAKAVLFTISAACRIGFAALADVIHVAPLYVLQWI